MQAHLHRALRHGADGLASSAEVEGGPSDPATGRGSRHHEIPLPSLHPTPSRSALEGVRRFRLCLSRWVPARQARHLFGSHRPPLHVGVPHKFPTSTSIVPCASRSGSLATTPSPPPRPSAQR